MAVNVTLHPALEALLEKVGTAGIGHPSDGSRAFLLSKVVAAFDVVGSDVNVLLRLQGTSDAQVWPFAADPSATFDFANIVGDA
jgi:hypothetical protein